MTVWVGVQGWGHPDQGMQSFSATIGSGPDPLIRHLKAQLPFLWAQVWSGSYLTALLWDGKG